MDDRFKAAGLLILSNSFMTMAWYGHLRFKSAPLWLAILASWGIAFFEGRIFAAVAVAFP